MPSRKRIDLEKVKAALNTTCPTCSRVTEPAEIRHPNFDEIICPECDPASMLRRLVPCVRRSHARIATRKPESVLLLFSIRSLSRGRVARSVNGSFW